MSQQPSPDNREIRQREERNENSFWLEYYPKLQRYCHFLTQNKWDGDDIAQETFLKAQKYSAEKISSALLNKMAYHHWIDLNRKRKHERPESDMEMGGHSTANQLEDVNAAVDLLLKQFTPKQAVIFLLKEGFQYQGREIADILETTETAVKSTLYRAKQRLEKGYDQDVSLESFWGVEEREQLAKLFSQALKNQDPTILIKMIPSIKSVTESPKLVSGPFRKIQTHSPSSTLCMAA